MGILHIILAILFPPLAVFKKLGISRDFWLNVLLTVLGFIPGAIHAIILSSENDNLMSDCWEPKALSSPWKPG